jgi:hypothetical protein
MTNSGELIAINGVIIVNDTVENTTHADSYYVAEDTVIASIKINGAVADVKALYISAPAVAVKGGVLITPQSGAYFSGITLTSGSVVVILK